MSGDRGAAEPARYALLGLLLECPSHGYDLARRFEPASPLGDIVRLSPSHMYAMLTRLERDGLISGHTEEVGARPQRRVYALTASGSAMVAEWLSAPVEHPRDMRIEFPLKLYLARMQDQGRASTLIQLQRQKFQKYIARLQAVEAEQFPSFDAAYVDLMRRGRIGRAESALEWLAACERVLSNFDTPTD